MKILFLCTANSARSVMAEAITRQFAGDAIEVYSAGTAPTQVEPEALAALQSLNLNTEGLRSKSVDDLPDIRFDYVISLCDRARTECQASFQGMNFIAWDFPDPVASPSADAFKRTAQELSERIRMFLLIIRKRMQQPHLFNTPEDFFKIMADPLRLTMILMLDKHHELCVCDFVDATGMSQPKVSRHLAQLREYGLLIDRKEQRWVHYQLNTGMPDWMRRVIALTAQHNPHLQQDVKNGCI
ncbi:metalloregulator ArsR/SmtB family transcription factor [Pseudidiomarina sp.]|uniref:metalloregulator ArsR/SmtB family transcription factor n=1 Tax=Pseudidiomarina sp. TaxID=2081707 RepID=UPI003A970968